jgi:FixJ family two-component response regulator
VPTVYIVDDDASVRKALGRLIRSAGYDVEVFGGAAEYLAREAPKRPACLVVDIRMPGMTGVELQRTIEGTQMALPIVFITGHGDDAIREQSLAAGAVDVLYKPVGDDVLLAAIEKALWRSVRH